MLPALKRAGDTGCETDLQGTGRNHPRFSGCRVFQDPPAKRWGGYEMDPEAFYAVQMTLAEGCMSSAWVLGVVAVHNWQLALFDAQAQADVWSEDPTTLISSSYMPRAEVTPVEGGYRISGRWGFSSGVDHCDWAFLGGLVPDPEGGAPDYRTFLVPRSDFEIDHNWDTLGLRGTGSHDVTVKDAFRPRLPHPSLQRRLCGQRAPA
jgi:3-hydroxy-9,10-secoandrosta-1,3,5(10)-triene-9,17-dione monooxygenase